MQKAFNEFVNAGGLESVNMVVSFKDFKQTDFQGNPGVTKVAFHGALKRVSVGTSQERDLAWFNYCDVRDGVPSGTTRKTKFHTIMGITLNGLLPPEREV